MSQDQGSFFGDNSVDFNDAEFSQGGKFSGVTVQPVNSTPAVTVNADGTYQFGPGANAPGFRSFINAISESLANADGRLQVAPLEPSSRIDGEDLIEGDIWINTGPTEPVLNIYDGTTFISASGDDPRIVRSGTVPALDGSVLIWIDTRQTPNTFNFWNGTTFTEASGVPTGSEIITAINNDATAGQIDPDHLNLDGLQVAPYARIFFNLIFDTDNTTLTGVGDASTVRDEFTQGGTQHTTRHTHYAFVERNSTRYFDQDAGTAAQILASFNASETFIGLLETDVLVGRLEYIPLATRSNNDFTIHNNTWHWTEGAYYEIGDIVAYTGNDNLQFYLVSGSDIVSALSLIHI